MFCSDFFDNLLIFSKRTDLSFTLSITFFAVSKVSQLTKNLVESMQGTITAYSIPNISTEFWLEFPFYNQEEALKCFQQS